MKSIFILLCIYASIVKAVNYHGFTPTMKQYITIEDMISNFNDNDIQIVSVVSTLNIEDESMSQFFNSGRIYNSVNNTNYTTSVNTKRQDTINYVCTSGQVSSHLTTAQETGICTLLAGLAGGVTAAGVAVIVNSKACTATDGSGATTFCVAAIAFSGTSTAYVTSAYVQSYCPSFLNLFGSRCAGTGGSGNTDDSNVRMNEYVTQSSFTCGDESVPCTTTAIG